MASSVIAGSSVRSVNITDWHVPWANVFGFTPRDWQECVLPAVHLESLTDVSCLSKPRHY